MSVFHFTRKHICIAIEIKNSLAAISFTTLAKLARRGYM